MTSVKSSSGYFFLIAECANFPKWLIKEYFLGEDIEFFDRWEDNLLMLRYDDEILVRNYEE
jgi:carbamoyl-phosphate synthase large subunit